MNPLCETFLEQLAAECAAERPWSASLEGHLAGCEACARRAERLQAGLGAVRALAPVGAPAALDDLVTAGFGAPARERRVLNRLSALERVEAPAGLEGRVVAATQPGHREDRAVAELRAVAGPGAPAALDGRLEGLFDTLREEGLLAAPTAPAELAARVDGDLQDPAAALSGRMLTKLPRVDAPEPLEERLEDELQATPPGLRLLRRPSLVAGLAAAAALVLFVGVQGLGSFGGDEPVAPEALALDFRVEHPAAIDGLSERGRELVARLNGGLAPALGGPSRVALETDTDPGAAAQQRSTIDGSSGSRSGSSAGAGTAGSAAPGAAGGMQASTNATGPNGSAANGGSQGGLLGGHVGPEYFLRVADAPFTTAYRGDRIVTLRTRVADVVHVLEYVEDVASDGQGAFAVVPIQVLDPVMTFAEGADYLLRQESRDGFFYRFRDFRIRDFASFHLNYDVVDLGQPEVVAGVPCEVFEIRRSDGTGDVHRVAIDPVTALVLSERTTRPDGEVTHETRFQTLQLDADLSDLLLNDGVSAWTPVDEDALAGQLQHEPLLPTAPPTGYALDSVAVQANAGLSGAETWAQLTYGDGVDTAFFLFEDTARTAVGNAGPQFEVGAQGDLVRAYSFGSWTMIEGDVRGRRVLAVGKVQETELLLMLQSAVE